MAVFSDSESEISPARAAQWMREDPNVQLIDVRETYEHQAGHIAQARHVELERLASEAASIDRRHPVIFQCRLGARSAMAAQAFRASGYDAYTMTGGLQAWVNDDLPLSPADGHVADH